MRILSIVTVGILMFAQWPADADSWAQPRIANYTSQSGGHTFTVEPLLDGQKFSRIVTSAARQDVATNAEYPKGRLVAPSGEVLWERKLVNDVAPVNALVSADGRFVITFDNWFRAGYGSDVMVIYGQSGQVIREFSLGDIVGYQRVSKFPRSISSREWSGDHEFESEEILSLRVLAERSDLFSEERKFETIRIRLEDGVVLDR